MVIFFLLPNINNRNYIISLTSNKSRTWCIPRSRPLLLYAPSLFRSRVWRDASFGIISLTSLRCTHAPFPRLHSLNRALLHERTIVLVREERAEQSTGAGSIIVTSQMTSPTHTNRARAQGGGSTTPKKQKRTEMLLQAPTPHPTPAPLLRSARQE